MKKNRSSVWDKKMLAFTLRWRWVITFGAVLQLWGMVQQYKMHDVADWLLLPSAWVLPWLTFGCAGVCVFTASLWADYLHKPRPNV